MMYEIDRKQDPSLEPSLLEMVETALTSLDRATKWSFKGYFLMIEASRIDVCTTHSTWNARWVCSDMMNSTRATQTIPSATYTTQSCTTT